jgi:hypothetical protein
VTTPSQVTVDLPEQRVRVDAVDDREGVDVGFDIDLFTEIADRTPGGKAGLRGCPAQEQTGGTGEKRDRTLRDQKRPGTASWQGPGG